LLSSCLSLMANSHAEMARTERHWGDVHPTMLASGEGHTAFFQNNKSVAGMTVHKMMPEMRPGGSLSTATIHRAHGLRGGAWEADAILSRLAPRCISPADVIWEYLSMLSAHVKRERSCCKVLTTGWTVHAPALSCPVGLTTTPAPFVRWRGEMATDVAWCAGHCLCLLGVRLQTHTFE